MKRQHECTKEDGIKPQKTKLFKIIVVVPLLISIISLFISLGTLRHVNEKMTSTSSGDINLTVHSASDELINDKININLRQPKVEHALYELDLDDESNLDDLDLYDSFGYQKRLVFDSYPMAQINKNYLYINNDGQVAETDLIIQFKSDKIYFESRNNKEENNIDSGSESILSETKYEFELYDFASKLGHTTLRIKVNPKENIYPGATEKIYLDNLFNEEVAWFLMDNDESSIPVEVTVSGEKCKSKTFTINLNITED